MSSLGIQLKGRAGALVAAFVVLLLGVVFSLLIHGLLAYAEGDTDSELQALARYHAEASERPEVFAELKQALRRAASVPGLMQAQSTSLAQAALDSDVKAIAKENGAEVRSADILPAERVMDYEAVSILYDLTVPMSRLRDLTYSIEAHTPYLFIDHATITGSQAWEPQGANSAKDPPLGVRWTIRAYRWIGKQ